MKRKDDFEKRRAHLAGLSEHELKERFWQLAGKICDPMVELARKHTTPAVERSVLLRMGFSSLDAKSIVNYTIEHGLMGKGAGHVVWKTAAHLNVDYRQAGQQMAQGEHWQTAISLFKGAKNG